MNGVDFSKDLSVGLTEHISATCARLYASEKSGSFVELLDREHALISDLNRPIEASARLNHSHDGKCKNWDNQCPDFQSKRSPSCVSCGEKESLRRKLVLRKRCVKRSAESLLGKVLLPAYKKRKERKRKGIPSLAFGLDAAVKEE